MGCAIHPKRKKGKCPDCGIYRCCPPSYICKSPQLHCTLKGRSDKNRSTYCSLHSKKKQGRCSCGKYKCCMPTDNCIYKTNHIPYKRINVTNGNNTSCTNKLPTRCSLSRKVKENISPSCALSRTLTFEPQTINTDTLDYSGNTRPQNSRIIPLKGYKQADL